MAVRVAAEVRASLGIEARLTRGSGGVFLVTKDGAPVFDKKACQRFPEPDEVPGLLR
ncbi:MAG: Rdx family protein [Candidatus Sericytochromatia bacterium]|nr:Rdx family protein [Candidatus Sericytochromatia bacterium]